MKDIQSIKKVTVGQYRMRITIEQAMDEETDIGGAARTYIPLRDTWASIKPMHEMYDFLAQRVEAQITHVIQMRWCADLVTSMRFRFGSRLFLIHSCVDPDERRRELLCFCEEIVS